MRVRGYIPSFSLHSWPDENPKINARILWLVFCLSCRIRRSFKMLPKSVEVLLSRDDWFEIMTWHYHLLFSVILLFILNLHVYLIYLVLGLFLNTLGHITKPPKNTRSGFLAPKVVFYHTLKYGIFFPKRPV